jgi:hypothetical protein
MDPLLSFYEITSFAYPTIHWIISVDNVGLKLCLLGISNSMITPTFFPLV